VGAALHRAASLRVLREQFPLKFEAQDNRVVFDRSVGEIAIPSADAELQRLVVDTLERQLNELTPTPNLAEGLTTILRGMLNGTMPTLTGLSVRAGMSERTLQRRLGQAGTSFQELLQNVLRETSDALLARGTLSQSEIAFVLGYSEVSAFSRAYRSWTGRAPGAARL
jgi:AraC-like DNA-binding protein